MADDSSLLNLYFNQIYRVKNNTKNKDYRNDYFVIQNEDLLKTFRCHTDNSCASLQNVRIRKYKGQKNTVNKHLADVNLTATFSHPKHSDDLSKKYCSSAFKQSENMKLIVKRSNVIKKMLCNDKYNLNVISKYNMTCSNSDPFHNPSLQANIKIYRCQISTKEETCCCSCNSDAMFEVMKSLYDCYKKKNCDHCNCILCGHLPREERRLGAERKSVVAMKTADAKEKAKVIKTALAEMKGKPPDEKAKIFKDLVMKGVPLPKGRTPSEEDLLKNVRTTVGLPPEPKTAAEKKIYKKAEAEGIITPLEGKSQAEKEKILKRQAELGVPLPEGRTLSEKALIQKVQTATEIPSAAIPSKRLQEAKVAGLLTPLEGKSPKQKEKILRGLAQQGLPLPEPKTVSEKKLIDKIGKDLGLPPKPLTLAEKAKYNEALAKGLITPLEGKTNTQKEKILKNQAQIGIPLPEGRTPSEKALIDKVKTTTIPSKRLQEAKVAGSLTPLEGKSPKEKENILRGLAQQGLPLPEPKTVSEKKLIDKVGKDLGLPPKPLTLADKAKYNEALAKGFITPLEGKTNTQKEKILKNQAQIGIPLPEGRTPSEKALIDKVKTTTKRLSSDILDVPLDKLKKSKAEKALIAKGKARAPSGGGGGAVSPPSLPTVQRKKMDEKTAKKMKEGKGPSDECICAQLTPEPDRVSRLGQVSKEPRKITSEKFKVIKAAGPEGRTPSSVVRIPSEKLRKAKAAGLITPLRSKTPKQKEKILRGLVEYGIPLPEPTSASERKLIDRVRKDMGLPPEPKAMSEKEKYKKAMASGLITPLEGKTQPQKRKILQGQAELGLPLPEGRTPSEKALIAEVKATTRPRIMVPTPSENLRKAKAAGLITPLKGKTTKQKEKILRGLVEHGIPLPEPTTTSDRNLIDKVRKDMGLPPEPKTTPDKEKYKRVTAAGLISPLKDKTSAQKLKNLQGQANLGLPLPEGRTPSEKALIAKVKASSVVPIPSEKLRKAEAAGLITPLAGKTPAQKEKILRGLALHGIPLPGAKTSSEKKIIDKVRKDMGLPPEPKTPSAKEKYKKALATGLLTPLEGKTAAQKEKILKGQANLGLPLPEGRTPSEKALIAKVKASSVVPIPSEKLRKAEAAGLITPLAGKTPAQKEKILRGLALHGIPLPGAKTSSEKKIIDKVRKDMGLPPEPETPSAKEKYKKALATGLLTPLEGKTAAQKEKILKGQANLGLSLPEGRTPSEKALIAKVKATAKPPEIGAKSSQRKVGVGPPALPPDKAKKLELKTAKVMKEGKGPSDDCICPLLTPESERESKQAKVKPSGIPSENFRKAKAAGFLTPLKGKPPEQKERILRGLAQYGIPFPEPKTASEKVLTDKVRKDLGLERTEKRPEGKTLSEKRLVRKVKTAAGLPPEITPSENLGKIKTKSKRVKAPSSRKSASARPPPPGVVEEFEDIVRTTTCDRGCGCDKKKIRFKHSYVKIKVTSPDIASLCPCPEECVPGVKGGVFTDNEGIKVTVGRVVGVPSYFTESNHKIDQYDSEKTLKCIYVNKQAANIKNRYSFSDTGESVVTIFDHFYSDAANTENKYVYEYAIYSTSGSEGSLPLDYFYNTNEITHDNFDHIDTCNDTKDTSARFSVDSYATPIIAQTPRENTCFASSSTTSSFESILIIKTESSLSLTTNSYLNGSTTISVISFIDSNISNNCHYMVSEHFMDADSDLNNNDSIAEAHYCINDYDDNIESNKSDKGFYTCSIENYQAHINVYKNRGSNRNPNEPELYGSHYNIMEESKLKPKDSSIIIVSNINREEDLIGVVNKIVNEKELRNGSSIYIVTCSDHETESIMDSNSTIYLRLSNVSHEYNNNVVPVNIVKQPKTENCPYGFKFDYECKGKRTKVKSPNIYETAMLKSRNCGTNEDSPNANRELLKARGAKCNVGMDTFEDRPCCCCPEKADNIQYNQFGIPCTSSALSDPNIPIKTKENETQGLRKGIVKYRNTSKCCTRSSKSVVLKTPPVPTKVCNIPPCNNSQSKKIRAHTNTQSTCMPEDLAEKMRKEMTSSVCVDTQGLNCGGGVLYPKKQNVKEDMCAGQCSHVKINDGKMIRCPCSGTENKAKLKRLCSCDIYTKDIRPSRAASSDVCGGISCETEGPKTFQKPCMCDQKSLEKKKSNKSTICECLPPPEPEMPQSGNQYEYDYEHNNDFEWVDVKEVKKMKSDLTQTTSGFTMNVVRRPQIQEEMSFEEALEYFGIQQPSPDPVVRDEGCSCDDLEAVTDPAPRPPLPPNFDCLCPEEPSDEGLNQNLAGLDQYESGRDADKWPLKGIKLTISGKGSGSTGLAGICCFDIIQEINGRYQSMPHAKSV